ncbi:MAG: GNAT family N-acetyltransferase [Firmicutes bacterium]|nr:GNAT family N-acetyltransferase [Bacillota bacterium]
MAASWEETARREAEAAWANECIGWCALGRAPEARGMYRVVREAGCVVVRPDERAIPGLPAMVIVERADGDVPARLVRALRALGPDPRPQYLSLPPVGDVKPWIDAARGLGFLKDTVQVLMTCPLAGRTATVPETAASISVVAAESDTDRKAALSVVQEVFRDPKGLTEFYNPRDVVRLYLVRVRGEPAAAAAMWPFGGVAGVYSVGTRPPFRRRGLAYAAVERILADAAREGFSLASLRTTGDLQRLYRRHGFRARGRVLRLRRTL